MSEGDEIVFTQVKAPREVPKMTEEEAARIVRFLDKAIPGEWYVTNDLAVMMGVPRNQVYNHRRNPALESYKHFISEKRVMWANPVTIAAWRKANEVKI